MDIIISNSAEETVEAGRRFAESLAGGEVMGFDEQGMPILASEYDSEDDSDYLSQDEDEDDEGEG